MKEDQELRDHLEKLMRMGQAFRPVGELLQGISVQEAGGRVKDLPYTIWQLLEHLRFTQHDILDFCRNSNYQEPAWPDDYWPSAESPSDQAALDQTLQTVKQDLDAMVKLVQDTENDLFAPIPHGNGQTLLREAMLIAEHNAYHLGQIVVLRRLLGARL
ncbi:DinB family protein [Pontibacter sp. HSC-14F20]|uniref:DinB family protein n=1 Tax=Pontibacter sp. HSC-14F20 TaxID=2864136 RepID=UPI001C72D86E|nr:DinB family protein [Pontibacter sp. HSC-14F20]MBX0334229.1 DinB family protein [Pontibacter sp. HSC-14F20]